jgi:hypothetical protein
VTQHILLRFLEQGLIDVGGDDAKLEKLEATAADLAATLGKSPTKTAPFALVAFDPQVAADDPVVLESLSALKNRWATYVNIFSGPPIAVVRAMLAQALSEASASNDRIGIAFVALARNSLPYMDAGQESAIWSDLLNEIEERLDARAEKEWATPEAIAIPAMVAEALSLDAPKVAPGKVDRQSLTAAAKSAAGPQYHDPQKGGVATSGNPHWPQSNAQWVGEFGTRIATAIGDAVDAALAETSVQQPDIGKPLKKLVGNISAHVDGALRAVSGATIGLQRRTNLLWWKEALFSPSARVSYHDIPASSAAALMAFDLHRLVPTFSPASVAAFLSEAVGQVGKPDLPEKFQIITLIKEAREHANLANFRNAVRELVAVPNGRSPLLAWISHPETASALDNSNFRSLTGVAPQTELTTKRWAAWIFRELQAGRATTEAAAEAQRLEAASKPRPKA